MKTRLLLITQWFDPEPTVKGLVFAKELVRRGFGVEVVTGFPNYPGGAIYPGYRMKMLTREVIDGVCITRLPLYPSHSESAVGRLLNYVSFAASALIYSLFFAERPHVIYAYHPPLTVGMAAAMLRLLRRIPVVYDIQDIWPDTLRATGMFSNRSGLRLISAICGWVYRNVDHLVVLSPGFKRLLIERGVAADKIDVIYNWCNEEAIAGAPDCNPSILSDSGKFTILFAGNMGKAQALDAILDAASLLEATEPNIVFTLIGGGVEVPNLKRSVAGRGLTNVVFVPAVPMSHIGGILQKADALLVHLKRDSLFEITIPSKTQAYMAIGKPILMAVGGDASDLVRASACGVVAESENASSIAAAAAQLQAMGPEKRRAMSESARRYYGENMALAVGARRFADLFDDLARAGANPRP